MPTIDVLTRTPEFEWRGKKYPITDSEYSFRHEDAEHKLSFGEVTIVEPLGPQNPTFRYTIPMRQGITRGPYKNLFLQIPTLEEDCYNREPGDLVDPIYGRWTVKPVDYRSRASGTSLDGVDVEVSFVWAPSLDEDVRGVAAKSIDDLRNEAGALDEEVAKIARKYDEPYPGPMMDALDAPAAVLGQLDRQAERLNAQLEDFAYRAEKTERYLRRVIRVVRDPDAIGAYRTTRRIRSSAERSKRELESLTYNTAQIVLNQAKTLTTIAAESVMSIKELLSLNPSLAASPVVPPGTSITVYK